jgi:hypothetical protein
MAGDMSKAGMPSYKTRPSMGQRLSAAIKGRAMRVGRMVRRFVDQEGHLGVLLFTAVMTAVLAVADQLVDLSESGVWLAIWALLWLLGFVALTWMGYRVFQPGDRSDARIGAEKPDSNAPAAVPSTTMKPRGPERRVNCIGEENGRRRPLAQKGRQVVRTRRHVYRRHSDPAAR